MYFWRVFGVHLNNNPIQLFFDVIARSESRALSRFERALIVAFFSRLSPQLLNQFENTGPPPADREKIKNLPTVQITEEHVGEWLPAQRASFCCVGGGQGETSG